MHNKVYVDDLAAVTTERDLIDLFSSYGNVAEVNIAVDRIHHKLRSFGFDPPFKRSTAKRLEHALSP
jgi:RNA recognition motif-containing protein